MSIKCSKSYEYIHASTRTRATRVAPAGRTGTDTSIEFFSQRSGVVTLTAPHRTNTDIRD